MKAQGAYGAGTPVKILIRLAAVCAVGCVAGLVFLRWVFWRDLGVEYAQTFYTLKSMYTFLVPTLVLAFLLMLLVASLSVLIVSVFASHKIAGPLFRLQRAGEYVDKFILIGHIKLREGDWFKGVAADINAWVAARKKTRNDEREWAENADSMVRDIKLAAGRGDFARAREILTELKKSGISEQYSK